MVIGIITGKTTQATAVITDRQILIVGEAVTGPVEGTGKTVDIKMGLPITDIILRTYSAEGVAIDIKIRALIDSGSEISIISNNKIKLMDNIIIDSTSEIKLTNAVQNEITTINRNCTQQQ